MERKPRTRVDWSTHELIIEEYDTHTVHWLKKPNTISSNVKFTNIHGQLLVTGDFWDWVFCRSFVPSSDGYVSDHYWCEKLVIANHNLKYKKFDTDYTQERILKEVPQQICEMFELYEAAESKVRNMIKEAHSYIDENTIECLFRVFSDTQSPDVKKFSKWIDYWGSCYNTAYDEYEYIAVARDIPDGDTECCIFGKEVNHGLLAIFDAFDEICRRLKEKENTNSGPGCPNCGGDLSKAGMGGCPHCGSQVC